MPALWLLPVDNYISLYSFHFPDPCASNQCCQASWLVLPSVILTCSEGVQHDPCQQAASDQFVPLRNADQRRLRESGKTKSKTKSKAKAAPKATAKARGEAKAKSKATKKEVAEKSTEQEVPGKQVKEKVKSEQLVSKEDQARYKALLGFHVCACSFDFSRFPISGVHAVLRRCAN